jgi:hypothetical protein
MLSRFAAFLKSLLFGKSNTTATVQVQPEPEKKPFSIPHDWPFPSPEPPNPEYLVGELIKGVQVEGDHVFFFWEGQKRRHIRTTRGTETILARHIVWWMEGRKVPSMANGLTTNCGEDKCIKLSHLILRMPQTPLGPVKSVPVKIIPKSQQPPEPKHVVKKTSAKGNIPKAEKGDRSKCITRKVYFKTDAECHRKARELNDPKVRGRGRRQYSYRCTMCDGYHLTKHNPKKYKTKKIGSW